ncbi:MAG: hypothetical protein H0V82_07980 [Candidatus Protochlamydia sp.]|nr:hypothetical protein [Candidatus Protochlamydia sp.]
MIYFFFFLLPFLVSCSKEALPFDAEWQTFNAREETENGERMAIYRAKVPSYWTRIDPSPKESLLDTKKPICEFIIEENVRLTIHTFYTRISPFAQISRWKAQFQELNSFSAVTTPRSQGGFVGLFFEGEGQYQGKAQKMMGWSMRLAPEYDQKLELSPNLMKNRLQRADYTIKVVGPVEMVDRHRKGLLLFANSFELIDELPAPL